MMKGIFIGVIPDIVEKNPHSEAPSQTIKGDDVYQARTNYLSAVVKAGARPFLVPYDEAAQGDAAEEYLSLCHGLLIIGGGFSVDPALFNQPKTTPLPLKLHRTAVEMRFFHQAFQKKMPILGICGGMQLINVALGGSLIQHLPSQYMPPQGIEKIDHSPDFKHYHDTHHTLFIEADSELSRCALGLQSTRVNSSHSQAIDQLGENVRISARAEDGVIEAIEVAGYPFCWGTQWHPEYHSCPDLDPLIFENFIHHARIFSQRKACTLDQF